MQGNKLEKPESFVETTEYLNLRIKALEKELNRKESEIEDKNRTIHYYENLLKLKRNGPANSKPLQRYPACAEPITEIYFNNH